MVRSVTVWENDVIVAHVNKHGREIGYKRGGKHEKKERKIKREVRDHVFADGKGKQVHHTHDGAYKNGSYSGGAHGLVGLLAAVC